MRRLLLVAAALSLFALAALGRAERGSPTALGRALVRPVLLPVLLGNLDRIRRSGTPEEYAGQGRLLMQLLPEWTDGHIHVAWELAFAGGGASEVALDRLMTALELLEEACRTVERPPGRDELRRAQVRFLLVRCQQDPALAAAWAVRTGDVPAAATRRYLEQIQGFRSSPYLKWDLLVTVHDGLPTEIELGRSREHLVEVVETQLGLLADLPATEVRDEWRRSLEDLRSYLHGTDDIGLDDLAADPRLAKIVEALRENPGK